MSWTLTTESSLPKPGQFTHQVFPGSLPNPHHAHGIWRYRLVVEHGVQDWTGRWSLVALGGHRIMGFQEGLRSGRSRERGRKRELRKPTSKINIIPKVFPFCF